MLIPSLTLHVPRQQASELLIVFTPRQTAVLAVVCRGLLLGQGTEELTE